MKPGQIGKLQWAITRHALESKWPMGLKNGEMLSRAECKRLIRQMDAKGYASAGGKYLNARGDIGRKNVGYFFADYCKLRGLEVRGFNAPPVSKIVVDRAAKHAVSDDFLRSFEWRRVRMQILKRDGARCACCGASPETGAVMNVDHIKPRRLFPALALDPSNLQVLCNECNHGKGNWDMTDWRRREPAPEPA